MSIRPSSLRARSIYQKSLLILNPTSAAEFKEGRFILPTFEGDLHEN